MKKILFLLLCLCTAAIQADVYNVKDYGAKADGKTIDSPAINRAIQEAAANGGGTVYLPATKRKPTNTTATRISATATGRTRSSGASDWKTSPSAARD